MFFAYGFQSQKQLETAIPIICYSVVTVEEMIALLNFKFCGRQVD